MSSRGQKEKMKRIGKYLNSRGCMAGITMGGAAYLPTDTPTQFWANHVYLLYLAVLALIGICWWLIRGYIENQNKAFAIVAEEVKEHGQKIAILEERTKK